MIGILERDADLLAYMLKQNAVIVDATEATNWFYEESDQEDWDLSTDMHRLTAPGIHTWIEFQTPRFSLTPNGPVLWKNGIQRVGAHVICLEIEQDDRERVFRENLLTDFFCKYVVGGEFGRRMWQANKDRQDITQDRIELAQSKILPGFVLGVRVYTLAEGHVSTPSVYAMYLTEDGKAYPRALKAASLRYSLNAAMAVDAGALDSEMANEIISTMILPFAFTLSLMNCRNVILSEPQEVHTRNERRRLERANSQPVAYRWLRIGQLQRQVEDDAENKHPGKGRQRRMHQVRAHWATYTKEAPLFGTWTGTLFRRQSLRGRPELGTIEKGYRPVPYKNQHTKETQRDADTNRNPKRRSGAAGNNHQSG